MSAHLFLALAFLFASRPTHAFDQDDPSTPQAQAGADVDEDALRRQVRDSLGNDPAVADSLAARIDRSKIGPQISKNEDPETRLAQIRQWIDAHPDAAADLAIGLSRDDANGTSTFEDSVTRQMRKYLKANPNAEKGIFGRLKKDAHDSHLMKGQAEGMADEEQREVLKTLFEGQGSQSGQIITQKAEGKTSNPATPSSPRKYDNSYFDRLSQTNLRGYSPQLQALQSSLNARRVPGAPRLIETGKLDFATLSYPAYGMRFDLSNLEKRLAYERNYALAKLLGLEGKYSADQLLDPAVEKALQEKAAGKALPERFSRRRAALDRAAAAMREFQAAAQAAQDPNQITRGLLIVLGGKQKEGARWITVASLEEELQRLEAEQETITPDFYQIVQRCPAEPNDRQAYVHRGELFESGLATLKAADESAIKRLQADDWQAGVAEVDQKLAHGAALRKDLSRNLEDYRSTAYRFARTADEKPSWRRTLDYYVERLLPSSAYAKTLRSQRRQQDLLRDAFLKIAAGSFEAAHAVLVSDGAARR